MTKLEKRILRLFANPRDCSLQEILPVLSYYGFSLERITGSHYIFKNHFARFPIPVHNNKIKKIYILKLRKIVQVINIPYEN